jgi:hypothetical protein
MSKRVLTDNVAVDGKWYGPAYGNEANVPDDVAERIGDHAWAAVEAPITAAGVEGSTGEDVDAKPLDKRNKAELVELAEAHDPPIDASGTKAEILERLTAAGVEG